MKFEYTGRHLEVTPALRSHVENHFERLKHLFNGENAKAHTTIEVVRGRHQAEIIVKWRDHVLTAETTETDMYQALSKSIDKIEKQALKLKNKVIDRHHKVPKSASIKAGSDELAPEPQEPKVIPSDRFFDKPLTTEEAIINLKNEENSFLVFRSAESSRISVLFKRKDGNYGLIQP